MRQRRHKLGALFIATALVAAACGGDDDEAEDTVTSEVVEDTEGETETTEGETETTEGDTETTEGESETTEPPTDTTPEGPGDPVVGGTLVVGQEAETDGIRIWEDACANACRNINLALFDSILGRRDDGTIAPVLAESIEPNEDLTEWTVVLRDGITFHDGTPLTAQAVADMFPIQQAGPQSAGVVSSAGLTEVVAVDDLTVRYVLSKGNAGFPDALAEPWIGSVWLASSVGDNNAESWATEGPISTGPFLFESWDRDNQLVVTKNPNYWREVDGQQLPYLDEIIFRPIPDESARLNSLLSGDIDVMQTLRQSTIRDARDAGDENVVMYEHQGSNSGGSIFNTAVAPVDDVRVRQGLVMAIDQEVLIDILGGTGISDPATQMYSTDSPWFSEEAAEAYPDYDPEAATAKLQEYVDDPARSDGKAPGEPIALEYNCPPDPSLIQLSQAYQEYWQATGLVEVNLNQVEQTVHVDNGVGAGNGFIGTYMINCWRVGADQDPSNVLNNAFGPVDTTAGNFTNYFDQAMYDKLLEAQTIADYEERKAIYDEVAVQLATDVPQMYTGYTATALGTLPTVGGISGWVFPDGTTGSPISGITTFAQAFVTE